MIIALIIICILLAVACTGLWISLGNERRRGAERLSDADRLLADQRATADRQMAAMRADTDRLMAIQRSESEQRVADLREEHRQALDRAEAEAERQLTEQKAEAERRLSQQKADAQERLEELQAHNTQLMKQQEERFRNLANEIMEANAKRFNESSSQKINDLLSPLKENIENFRKVVGDTYNNESRERFSLQKELRELLELNKTIGREARDLTRALRSDSKVQGDWGEMILEQLLEKSGLQKGVHFEMQVTRDTDGTRLASPEGGSLRADVVVFYPDDRCLVIDSKVSLTAFVDYVNLADDADDTDGELRRQAGARHLASVRSHIAELQRKNYQDLIGKKRMDFVMMFIPNEAAYIAAMQLEPGLWQEAYDKRVLMVSPTQLISVLRMLLQLWKQDAINRNVEEIGRLAGTMLDKFTGMMDAFDDVEKYLGKATTAYATARSRMSEGNGNVFITARKILDLGAKATKQLPEK